MRRLLQLLFLTIVTSVLLAGCCTARHSAQQWEYKIVLRRSMAAGAVEAGPEPHRKASEQFLNDLGKDGWVLVGQDDGSFYFKRLKREASE